MSQTEQTPGQQAAPAQAPTGATPQGNPVAQPQSAQQGQPLGQPQVQPATAPGQQATPQPQSNQQEDTWQARFAGLQRVHQQTVAELQTAQQQAQQATEQTGQLTHQLDQWQQRAQVASTTLSQTEAQLAVAQREAAFYNMVTQEYPDLTPVAAFIQRAETPEAQRQVFAELRQRLGIQVSQQADQQVRANIAGATPGASPAPGGNPLTPSYEEVMSHLMDETLWKRKPEEFARWKSIAATHPDFGYASLGRGEFRDPLRSDYSSMQASLGQQPPPVNAQVRAQPIDNVTAPGMPGAWGGTRPPTPPE